MKATLLSFLLNKKYSAMLILILSIVTFGAGYFHYSKHQIEARKQTAEAETLQKNIMNALQSSKSEKDFRQAISDLAWGRHRQQGKMENQNSEPPSAPAQPEVALDVQQMQMLQGRMEYCMKNGQKDPSCGYRAQAPSNTSVK